MLYLSVIKSRFQKRPRFEV